MSWTDVIPLHSDSTIVLNTRRQRGDLNPCGQKPIDFEPISATARTQCHVYRKLFIVANSGHMPACPVNWLPQIEHAVFSGSGS